MTREFSPGSPLYRAQGFYSHPLTFAYTFAFILFFAVARAVYPERPGERRIALFAALVVEVALWTSGARGAWLATSILLFLGLLLFRPGAGALRLRYTLLPALALPILLLMTSSTFQTRASQLLEPDDQRPRLLFWKAAFAQLERRPVLGTGSGTFRAVVTPDLRVWSPDITPPGHAHQLFLQLWVEGGLLALLGFLWLVVRWGKLARDGHRNGTARERALLLGAAGGMGTLLLGGFTQDTLGDAEVQRMLAFSSAVLLAAARPPLPGGAETRDASQASDEIEAMHGERAGEDQRV